MSGMGQAQDLGFELDGPPYPLHTATKLMSGVGQAQDLGLSPHTPAPSATVGGMIGLYSSTARKLREELHKFMVR